MRTELSKPFAKAVSRLLAAERTHIEAPEGDPIAEARNEECLRKARDKLLRLKAHSMADGLALLRELEIEIDIADPDDDRSDMAMQCAVAGLRDLLERAAGIKSKKLSARLYAHQASAIRKSSRARRTVKSTARSARG